MEQRISLLEQKQSSTSASVVEGCDKSLAVLGGFGELEAKAAEELVAGAIENVDGLRDVYSTTPNPSVVFAKFDAPENMHKFVRTQKRHSGLQT